MLVLVCAKVDAGWEKDAKRDKKLVSTDQSASDMSRCSLSLIHGSVLKVSCAHHEVQRLTLKVKGRLLRGQQPICPSLSDTNGARKRSGLSSRR